MYVHPAVYGMPPPPPNVPYQHPSADGFNPVQNQYKSMMEQSVNVVQNTQQDMMSFTSIEQYQARVSLFHSAPCFLPYVWTRNCTFHLVSRRSRHSHN